MFLAVRMNACQTVQPRGRRAEGLEFHPLGVQGGKRQPQPFAVRSGECYPSSYHFEAYLSSQPLTYGAFQRFREFLSERAKKNGFGLDLAKHIRGRPNREQLSFAEDANRVAPLLGFVEVVRGEQHKPAGIARLLRVAKSASRDAGSRATVGSSSNRTNGSCNSAAAR